MKKAMLVFVLVTAGCASSAWEKTESVPGGKLYVPKVFAPLLPGSIYPDRKVPVKASGLPAIVLVCPEKIDCRKDVILEEAAARGLVVLATRSGEATISVRPEVDATRIGTLIVASASLKVETRPPAGAEALHSSLSKKILLASLLSAAPLETGDGIVLKLYSPNEKGLLPNEAFRDAVDWLAGELRIH